MNLSQYAKQAGVTKQYVSRLKADGKIVFDGTGGVDFDASESLRHSQRDMAKAAATQGKAQRRKPSVQATINEGDDSDEPMTYAAGRTRREWAMARLAEQKLAEEASQLLRVETVNATAFAAAKAWRDAAVAESSRHPANVSAAIAKHGVPEAQQLLIERDIRLITDDFVRAICDAAATMMESLVETKVSTQQ